MDNSRYIFLSSKDSLQGFPDNTPSSFRCRLPDRLHLSPEDWWCGLVECRLPTNIESPVQLCCNFIHSSIVGEFQTPILSLISDAVTRPNHVIYVPVKDPELSIVHLYLNTSGRDISPLTTGVSYCTLHLCNNEGVCGKSGHICSQKVL